MFDLWKTFMFYSIRHGWHRYEASATSTIWLEKELNCDTCCSSHCWLQNNHNASFLPYCGGVNVLSAVRYLCLIRVVSRANHRTWGSWDVPRADGAGTRFADWQSLLFKSNTFTDTTGTPFGMRWGGNPGTTWNKRSSFIVYLVLS